MARNEIRLVHSLGAGQPEGHRMAIIFNGVKFTGHCIGIDPEKGLILQLDAGGVRMFDAAHTTILR